MNYSLDASILQEDPIVLSSNPNNKNVILKSHGKSNIVLPPASKEFLNHQDRERQERKLQEQIRRQQKNQRALGGAASQMHIHHNYSVNESYNNIDPHLHYDD